MTGLDQQLDVKKLHYFYHAANFHSFRQAARYLQIAQPALTRHIQFLETELGVILFQRGGRSNKLTEAGQLLYERAHEIFLLLADTRSLVEQTRLRPKGTVTLAFPTSFSMAFLPELLNAFKSSLPEVHLRILEGSTRQVEDWLIRGQANIGVTQMSGETTNLIQEHLLTDELCLAGAERPSWLTQTPISFSSLTDLPLILPTRPNTTRRLVDEVASQEKISLTPALEIDSLYTTRQLMISNKFYSIVPNTALNLDTEKGTLFTCPLTPSPQRKLAIATLRGEPLSHASRSLALEIRKVIRDKYRNCDTAPPEELI